MQWTGVAEILGGLGLCLGCLPFDAVPAWLAPASAMGLFWLTAVVTPANIYMVCVGLSARGVCWPFLSASLSCGAVTVLSTGLTAHPSSLPRPLKPAFFLF